MSNPIFTVALLADTHINPVDGESGSPWRSNRLANARARWAVAALNADEPKMVFHLGDMVHPLPNQASYAKAANRFQSIFDNLDAPLHCLPGNHDIGDKPGDWMPAHPVTSKALETYRATFGSLWQSVDHGRCRFILHCNPILGSGLPEDDAQWDWLEAQLANAGDRRVFFLTHYPLFLTEVDEPEHYDNLAWPARARLRGLLIEHQVEAVFAAHVHTIFHTSLAPEPNIALQHVLPSVSAMRLDYSYLFRSPPGAKQEHGRNDAQKLGYYLLDVLPEGYRIRFRRSDGCALPEQQSHFDPGAFEGYREDLAKRPIGVDLRHGWAETVAVPYSGVVDEFRRKYVRNDYFIIALQEAGIRDLRLPVGDLRDPFMRSRLRDLGQLGHRFQIFTIDDPDAEILSAMSEIPAISRVEVIARPEALASRLEGWRSALAPDGPALFASRLWSSADIEAEAVNFSHGIGHGFFADDTDLMKTISHLADGAVVRVPARKDPAKILASLAQSPLRQLVLYVVMASDNPAQLESDERAQRERIAAAVNAARSCSFPVGVMIDTFDDHDRGYYPRHGLYDAQFNPRLSAKYLSRFHFS